MAADIPVPLRHSVHGRASGLCEYCRTSERLTGYTLEVDHIVPSSRGGESVSNNLCLCCRRCNAHKSNRLDVYPASVPIQATRRRVKMRQIEWISGTRSSSMIPA